MEPKFPVLSDADLLRLADYYAALQRRLSSHAAETTRRAKELRSPELLSRAHYYGSAAKWLRGEVGRLRQRLMLRTSPRGR